MAKNCQKMQFLTKNQVKLIFEVKYPFNHSGNPFKRYFGASYPLVMPMSTSHRRPDHCVDAIRATRFIRVDTREKFPDSIPIEIYIKCLII